MTMVDKYNLGRVVLESDKEVMVPVINDYYVLEKDGIEYKGRPGERGITVTFEIPFETNLIFRFEYKVLVQFIGKNTIVVRFRYADLYQVYQWLKSVFSSNFRLKGIWLSNELLWWFDQWPWNLDFILMQLRHLPYETLSFIQENLSNLITVMSIRKLPREFDESSNLWYFCHY